METQILTSRRAMRVVIFNQHVVEFPGRQKFKVVRCDSDHITLCYLGVGRNRGAPLLVQWEELVRLKIFDRKTLFKLRLGV